VAVALPAAVVCPARLAAAAAGLGLAPAAPLGTAPAEVFPVPALKFVPPLAAGALEGGVLLPAL